jgi:hypothetical protein
MLATQEAEITSGQIVLRTCLKKAHHNKGLVQVEEHMPTKPEALSSNPSALLKKGSMTKVDLLYNSVFV